MKTFTVMDPASSFGKGRILLILLLVGAGIGSFAVTRLISLEPFFRIGFIAIAAAFPLLAASIIYQDYLCRITIDHRGVTYTSPLRSFTILWSEARAIDGVTIGRGSTERFTLEQSPPAAYLASTYIFISKDPDPPLAWGMRVGPDLIFFKYRDEALAQIRLYRAGLT